MSERKRHDRPIGYWLKRADELLTARIDEVQRSNDLSRLDWQAINVVRNAGAVSAEEIAQTLVPFANETVVGNALVALTERGVVSTPGKSGYVLTSAGTELYEKALSSQDELRQLAAKGITEAEYATTVAVLERLVQNLEDDASA